MVYIYQPPYLDHYQTYQLHFVMCVLTNVFLIPLAYATWTATKAKKKWWWDTILGILTILASTMYHWTERTPGRYFLFCDERVWHIFDNMLSQTCTAYVIAAPIQWSEDEDDLCLLFKGILFLICVIAQTIDPFCLASMLGPLVMNCLITCYFLYRNRTRPSPSRKHLLVASLIFLCSYRAFSRGLDEFTDPGRFYHGLWHIGMGLGAYCWFLGWVHEGTEEARLPPFRKKNIELAKAVELYL